MSYHIALSRLINFDKVNQAATAGTAPRHAISDLSQRLHATIHQPIENPISLQDQLNSKIDSRPSLWALGRALASQLGSNDVIYCTGEDIGIPVAVHCGSQRRRPKIAMFAHNLTRPRAYAVFKLYQIPSRVDLFVTCSRMQYNFLRDRLNVPEHRLYLLDEQTDTRFFVPGQAPAPRDRPLIASVGLERRDYRTLAAATQDLDVDVKISGFSTDARVLARTFPSPLPANMTCRYYEWTELVQLYQAASVVVISLMPNQYGAGVTTLMEAMACRRPVIVTRTPGLEYYLEKLDMVTVVEPGDPIAMRQAILNLLSDPKAAADRAQRGYEVMLQQHTSEHYVATLCQQLERLETQRVPVSA